MGRVAHAAHSRNGRATDDAERATFKAVTGRDAEPGTRVEQLTCIVGRRGGKTRGLSVLTAYIAGLCDHTDVLTVGEVGVCLLMPKVKPQPRSRWTTSPASLKPHQSCGN